MDTIFNELHNALYSHSYLSLFSAFFLAYLGGILSSFTPCIYPMIPITVGFIGGSTERSIKDGWVLSSVYVLGMASIYTVLGIVASLSGQVFGSFTNTTGWYLSLGIILTLSSLWMMDVIQFDPNVWISKLSKKKSFSHNGHSSQDAPSLPSAFLLGASSGFIAAPCTTPVLTTILSFIATEKSIVTGALLMFCFACGMGTILVFVGTFTGSLKMLPKSGKWLHIIKLGSGFLILSIGEYFIFKAGILR